jgi:hypothetical protein
VLGPNLLLHALERRRVVQNNNYVGLAVFAGLALHYVFR